MSIYKSQNTPLKDFYKATGAAKRIIFFAEPHPARQAEHAMLKAIDGETVAQPIAINLVPERLSHLVPLVVTLNKRKKKRLKATGKHPATALAESTAGKAPTNRNKSTEKQGA